MIQPTPSFLVLEPNRPAELRVKAARLEDREITDSVKRQKKTLSILVLDVTEVNGKPMETSLSFTSFKAQQALAPLINSGELFRKRLWITMRGVGWSTEYEIRLL